MLLVTYGNLQTSSEAKVNAIIYSEGSVTLGYKTNIIGTTLSLRV